MTEETASRTVKQNTTREDAYLAALLAGQGVGEACKVAGISRSTGLAMRKSEDFQKRLREGRAELLEATITGLHSAAGDCVTTLHAIAINEGARGSDRVLAARHALDLLLRGVETLDFGSRIARLEQVEGGGRR